MIQQSFEDISEEYKAFVDKFKPKKTTDDCYTPENIFDAVATWDANKYGFEKSQIVRPFWPGGDFERFEYPDGCVVVDNPPFSILSKITRVYNIRRIRYFLFGPALTIFSNRGESNYICAGASVTYANGAVVNTSFVTNMGDNLIESAPDLRDLIKSIDDKNKKKTTKEIPKYSYPPDVVTAAAINYLTVHHTPYALKRSDAMFIRKLDAQVASDKVLFGGGFLLSERAAAERAAAERAAAERAAAIRWQLSEREKALQRLMVKGLK